MSRHADLGIIANQTRGMLGAGSSPSDPPWQLYGSLFLRLHWDRDNGLRDVAFPSPF